MLTSEDKKIIQEFNSNVRWLRQKEIKESYTASASDIMKITGWSAERLRGERNRKTIRFKKYGKAIRYDLSSLSSVYFSIAQTNRQVMNGRTDIQPPNYSGETNKGCLLHELLKMRDNDGTQFE